MQYLKKYKQRKNIHVYYLKDGFAGWLNIYYNGGDKTDDALYVERF